MIAKVPSPMTSLEDLEQELHQAQERCEILAQQLETERAAALDQADLVERHQQQAQRIERLEAQVDRLQWIINTSPATTYITEAVPPYACTYISQGLAKVLGYTPEEFQAEPAFWEQRLHPEDAPRVFDEVQSFFEQGYLQHDYRVRHRDGHYVWIHDELTLRRDAQGNPQEIVGYFTDSSESQRIARLVEQEIQCIAEENGLCRQALQAQEATYRHLFDCNPQPMWVYDLETLEFLAVNEAAVAKYGYSRAEFLAMTIADICPPEEVPRLLAHVAQVSTGLDRAGLWPHCLKDGQVIQVEITSYALDFEGRRAELVMVQDVTERERVGQALIQSEERYRVLVDFSPQLTWSADANGLNTYVSQRMSDYTGFPADQLMAFDWQVIVHPDDLDRVHRRWMEVLQTGQPYEVEYRLRRADGEYRWHLTQAMQVQYSEDVQWLGMSTDIHDRKQAELALQTLNQELETKVAERTADLKASHDHLQAMLAALPDHVFRVNREGQYLDFYPAAGTLEITGLDSLVGHTMTEVLPPDLAQAHRYRIDEALRTQTVQVSEQTLDLGNGQLTREVRVSPCGPDDVVFVIRDITARKQNETLLKRQLDAIEAAADGIAILQDGAYLYLNRAHLDLFGYTHNELIGQSWTVLYSAEELARFEQEVMPILGRDGAWCGEAIATRKDGTTFNERLSLTITDEGLLICVCSDISERKQAELALTAYAERVEDLYNNAPCGYYSLDTEGRIININNTALRWLDAPREAVLGQPITKFMADTSQRIFVERRAMLAKPGRVNSLDYEITLLSGDGGQMAVLISEELQKDAEGTILGSRATITDIGQRVRAEQVLQRQLTQENLLRHITARIRQSLDLGIIFETACNEVRQALGADRVGIFRFFPAANFNDGKFVAESRVRQYPSVVSVEVHDHCFGDNFVNLYAQGRYYAVTDIEAGQLSNCHADILRQFQVRANLVVPLVKGNNALWGLLCIHQCSGPRVWHASEINLVQQIATQLAIAINQASLYQRLGTELTVRQQAEVQIRQQLEQQRTLAKLIETVRESLAVDDILDNVAQQVKALLQCDRVIIFRLYPDGRSRIVEEAVSPEFATLKDQHWEDETWSDDILELYWQGRPRIVPDVMHDRWTDCLIDYSREGQIQSKMVAPILQEAHASEDHRWIDATGAQKKKKLWGIMVAHACREKRVWQEPEAEILQQVANSVAIAIQQASLFEQLQQELGVRQVAEQQLAERNQQLSRSNAQLERATRLKDEFLANMSHELRTPLNAILGMTEGLQEEVFGPITQSQQRSLATVERSSNHLLSLINDILDLSKIEAGQVELDFSAINVGLLCKASIAFVKQQSHKKRQQIITLIPDGLPDLYGDDRRLRQVLINLLTNAVKFTPEGGQITLAASYIALTPASDQAWAFTHPQANPADTLGLLTFSITDTGIGISPEDAQRLFQPFVQVNAALNRQYEGTGLGLSLVKRIVAMHGGEVTLTSEVGIGSCFTVQIPIIAIPNTDGSSVSFTESIAAAPPVDRVKPPLILLAEDNEANISTTSSYLGAKGYDLIVAKDGLEAINLAATAKPDLILMDIQMPNVDGLEAMRQIRQNPALATVPIIALTALAMPTDQDRCLAAGANRYLSKPISLKQLSQMMVSLLAEAATPSAQSLGDGGTHGDGV